MASVFVLGLGFIIATLVFISFVNSKNKSYNTNNSTTPAPNPTPEPVIESVSVPVVSAEQQIEFVGVSGTDTAPVIILEQPAPEIVVAENEVKEKKTRKKKKK